MQFHPDILKAVVLHTASTCPADNVGAVKLHKVLYYADMIHFAQYGRPLTGATYRKRPFGPTCEQLLDALSDLESASLLHISEVDYFGFRKKHFEPQAEPNLELFSEEQRHLLAEVIDFVCNANSAKTISDFSHNRAWEVAEFGEEIPYQSAFLIYPTQVSKEAFEWAASEAESVGDKKPDNTPMGSVTYRDFRKRLSA